MSYSKIIASFLLTLSVAQAHASIVGKYEAPKQVPIYYANDEASCKENGGEWDQVEGEEGMCLVSISDEVKVSQKKGVYSINIQTYATNFHSCEFNGKATLVKANKLVSKVKAEQYDYKLDKIVPVTCVVTAKFSGNKVSIDDNGLCRSFCGANGWLGTEAVKVK